MKKSATILGLSLMLSLAAASVSAAPLVTPSLSIAAPLSTVKSGQEVRVDINITNGSNKAIPLAAAVGKGNAEFDYDVKVTRKDGRPVERTQYGLSLVGAGTLPVRASKRLIDLQPSESYSDYVVANKIFDMTRPGIYLVQVEREPVPGMTGMAQSNSIEVVVH